jgi:hypothetical protein
MRDALVAGSAHGDLAIERDAKKPRMSLMNCEIKH